MTIAASGGLRVAIGDQMPSVGLRATDGYLLKLRTFVGKQPSIVVFFGGPTLRWSGNEVAVAEAGEVLRIDRLVELEDEGRRTWWVLDYKLSHAPEAMDVYRAQLLRYRRAVQAAQPGAEVRCAFITGAGAVVEVQGDAIAGV